MDDNRVFVGAGWAYRYNGAGHMGTVLTTMCLTDARSLQEARGIAYEIIYERWPVEDGWMGHAATVDDVSHVVTPIEYD